jgi:hypothetical protein
MELLSTALASQGPDAMAISTARLTTGTGSKQSVRAVIKGRTHLSSKGIQAERSFFAFGIAGVSSRKSEASG